MLSLYMLTAIGQGYLLLMAGTVVYVWMRWRRSKEQVELPTHLLTETPTSRPARGRPAPRTDAFRTRPRNRPRHGAGSLSRSM